MNDQKMADNLLMILLNLLFKDSIKALDDYIINAKLSDFVRLCDKLIDRRYDTSLTLKAEAVEQRHFFNHIS